MSTRRRKLDAVVAAVQSRYGPAALQRAAPAVSLSTFSTTFPDLDAALGGGWPIGRISEIIGPATSGKVTLAAKAVASAQRRSHALAAWLDLSRTCDPDYMHRCGVDLERLLVVRPATPADALAITLHLVQSQSLAVLVFDSLADLAPAGEALLAGVLERLAAVVTHTEVAVIFLAEPHAQSSSLAHVATVRLAIRRERWLTRGADIRGYEGQATVLKHKLGRAGAAIPIRITFNGTVRAAGLP